jgi:hypothetical protein
MMEEYALTASEHTILRTADQAYIPDDPANTDYAEYLKWLEAGGVPDPYVEPPPPEPAPPHPAEVALYDHEARITTLEGGTPLTMSEFRKKHGF